jgi:hypothetical protein
MSEQPDANVPKTAERNFQREQKQKDSMQGWMLEALDSGPTSALTEDDRGMQMERDRVERMKLLAQEKKEKTELASFLAEQKTVKAETLVIGKTKGATTSVLGDAVMDAEPKTKKQKNSVVVVVVAKDNKVGLVGKAEQQPKKVGALSMLGAYKK